MNRTGSTILRGLLLATSGLVGSTLLASTAAMAGGGPAGGTVAVGSATIINASPTQTLVNQSSKKALINWNSFSIPGGSSVKFNQPTSKSLTVNRVTGLNASIIDGQILATGNVWLINANGVLFGKGSQINVGALLATTSDLSDDDFKNGNYNFKPATNPNAAVVNKGTITAGANGSVILSAPRVSNEGLIQANLGTVVLGGANAFTVDMTGDNLLRYQITAPVTNAPKDANGSVASALVSNSGTILAAGGQVMMTARAARNVEDNVINNTGMVEATSVSAHNGVIDLDAGPDGTVNDGGTLNASGTAQGQTGGAVNVTGGTVNVADGAKIDASGNAGGGTIQIGGGLHGGGTLAHAQRTIIGNATISADATGKGNGGTVAVWSDGDTSFAGSISAKGGAQGGNGGQVETSGHNLGVASTAKVDTSVPLGLTGDWLLDPTNIVIQTGGGTPLQGDGTLAAGAGDDTIAPATIISQLGTTNVTLEATNSISVNSNISYSLPNTLSLLAEGDINVNASIQNAGTGAINAIAGWDGSTLSFSPTMASAVYGGGGGVNGFGNITLVSGEGHSTVAVGSAGGQTLVAGYNIELNAPVSSTLAQIGYHGAGGGNIAVLAANNLTLDSGEGHLGAEQIGNGAIDGSVSGNVTGDIYLDAGGFTSINNCGTITYLGNTAAQTSTETGDVTVITNGGDFGGTYLTNDLGTTAGTGGNVFVGITGTSGTFTWDFGDYNSANTFTIAAGADLAITRDIANGGSGNVNVIAGWDGHTTDLTALTNPSVYGLNNQGNVTISGNSKDVSVGSASGAVLVEGFNVTLNADAGDGYAQIGYNGGGTGNITVNAQNDVMLYASDNDQCDACFAQIGNGGSQLSADASGNINVSAGGYVSLNGGAVESSYVQIGNGGEGIDGTIGGNITVQADGAVTLTGGEGSAQIGNGGDSSTSTNSGDIVVNTTGAISLTGSGDYAQIGNGGYGSQGSNGTIAVTAGGDLTLDNDGYYALIGNGGEDASNASGDVSINVTGTTHVINLGEEGFVWVGNLVGEVGVETGNVSLITGDLDTESDNSDSVGNFISSDILGGDVTIGTTDIAQTASIDDGLSYTSANTLTILAAGNIEIGGGIQNSGTGAINLVAGWDGQTTNLASLGNTGVYGNNGKDLTIAAGERNAAVGSKGGKTTILGYDIVLDASGGAAQIGFNGAANGAILVHARHDIVATAGAGSCSHCYAQIGNGGTFVAGPDSGNITVQASGNITLTAGGGTYNYASIGNGGDTGSHNDTGEIAVTAGGSISLFGATDYAQIGNGQWGSDGSSGNISVGAAGNITLTGGSNSPWGYAQIGNGGQFSQGAASGDINVSAGGTVALTAGNNGMYAQIGNGGNRVSGYGNGNSSSGNISLSAGNLSLLGAPVSSGGDDYAGIGNTAFFNSNVSGSGTATGNIAVNVTGNTTFTTTMGQGHVWIGNFATGGPETGSVSILSGIFNSDNENNDDIQNFVMADLAGGNLTIGVKSAGASLNIGDKLDYSSANNLTLLTAGNLTISGGIQNGGSGNITLVTGWNPNVAPSSVAATSGAYGNNNATLTIGSSGATGNSAVGSASGTTTVLTKNLNVTAVNGDAVLGYAGLGHGNIVVNATGNIAVVGASSSTFAEIGNLGILNQTVSGNITIADAGSFTLTNGILGNVVLGNTVATGNVGLTAASFAVSGASFLSGSSADLTLTGAGAGIGSAGNTLNTVVGAIAIQTNNGSVFLAAPQNSLSIGVGSHGINLGAGSLTLATGGSITQTAAIKASSVNLSATSGSISLTNATNTFGTLALSSVGDATVVDMIGVTIAGAAANGNLTLTANGSITQTGAIAALSIDATANGQISLANAANEFGIITLSSAGDATVSDSKGLTVGGATVGGNFTLTAGGPVTQTAAIKAATINLSATQGSISLANAANAFGTIVLSAKGNATIGDASSLTVAGATVGGNLTLLSKGNLIFTQSIQLLTGALVAVAGWNGSGTTAASGVYGNNGGSITIGGSGASGDVAVGSKSGATTLAGADINLQAANGFAQIGYHGGGSGAINVLATDDVTLTGGSSSDFFAQIGDGGFNVTGSSSSPITVQAGGGVALDAGAGQEAYAQIGNGGAESNSNSSGYGETGLVTVSGETVTLNAGGGAGSYAQIGHGGYKSGQSLNGIATLGGDISVNAVDAIRLAGGGDDAYAQIGHGGDFLNNNAADGASGALSGNITVNVVAASTPSGGDPLTLTAGTGVNSYTQIGNGGQGENSHASGATVTFDIGGNVTVADLTLTGSNTGANGYAQIGNGDASKTGTGNVSGQVALGSGTFITNIPGSAPGSSAGLGNGTGFGTVTGSILPGAGVDAGTQGSVASITQNPVGPTSFNITTVTVTPENTQQYQFDNNLGPQGPTPLEQLADQSNAEGKTTSDSVAQSVGQSLGDGKTIYVTSKVLIPGMLKQIVTLTRNNPNGIPPADEDYSSWGNEALWRW